MKGNLWIVLLAAALSASLAARTLTEQLQKGIYTEETLRNHTEAAKICRQIIAAPSVPQSIAQEASRRLARLTAPPPILSQKIVSPAPGIINSRHRPPLNRCTST